MKDRRTAPLGLVAAIVTLSLVVSGFILRDVRGEKPLARKEALEFQRTVGGLGMGAVLVPAWNFSDFDPRLQDSPLDRIYPVPGGFGYTPDRLAMVIRPVESL